VTIGLTAGTFFGALAFADSGLWVSGLAVLVILTPVYGIMMARRMGRFWPAAKQLKGADRVAVARAARRGETIGAARLAPAVIDYSDGLHAAYEQARPYRWVLWLLVAATLLAAGVDTYTGPIRTTVVSWLFVVFFAIELWWWPKEQARLVANAQRAANFARSQRLAP
jgi:hypothetical protein